MRARRKSLGKRETKSNWIIANVQRIKSWVPEEDKRILHVDDNTEVMLQYNIKSQEREGRIEHVLRVRAMRGHPYDSRWRRLRLSSNGEVALADWDELLTGIFRVCVRAHH
jgi:hypothetical protein